MNSFRKNVLALVSIAQIIVLFCFQCLPGYALTAATAVSDAASLEAYEKSLYGYAKPQQSTENRLSALETSIFGAVQKGDESARLKAVGEALDKNKVDYLLPPLAPKLDVDNTMPSGSSYKPDYKPVSPNAYASSNRPPVDNGYNQTGGATTISETTRQTLQQATLLYSQHKVPEAEGLFKQVLLSDPRNADAYYNLGVIAEGRGDLQSALHNYQRAASLDPGDSELARAVASLQNRVDDKFFADRRANSQQQQAAALASAGQERERLKGLVSDAQTAYQAGKFDRAIADLQSVTSQAPNDPDVQYALAQAYRGKGDIDAARQALNRAISLDPRNPLYLTAMNELNKNGASRVSTPDAGNVANQGFEQGGRAPNNGQLTPFSGNENAPAGSLTPFTSQGESQLAQEKGYQRGWADTGGPGFGFGGGIHGGGSARLKRAAIGAASGMAIGALMGIPSHSVGRSAMRGAALGGVLGLITGGL